MLSRGGEIHLGVPRRQEVSRGLEYFGWEVKEIGVVPKSNIAMLPPEDKSLIVVGGSLVPLKGKSSVEVVSAS